MSEKAGSSSRKGYGTYHNVFLSEDELSQLMARFPHDYMDRIENLSLYQKSHGRTYSDHMATILGWALRDKDKQKSGSGGRGKGVPKDYSREHNLTL